MATILPWANIEIGELNVGTPAMPCLLVHTSYIDGQPESSVTFFWQDNDSGLVNHEVLLMKPIEFDEALAWAEDHAASNRVKRIHVQHAHPQADRKRPKRISKAGRVRKSLVTKTHGDRKKGIDRRRRARRTK